MSKMNKFDLQLACCLFVIPSVFHLLPWDLQDSYFLTRLFLAFLCKELPLSLFPPFLIHWFLKIQCVKSFAIFFIMMLKLTEFWNVASPYVAPMCLWNDPIVSYSRLKDIERHCTVAVGGMRGWKEREGGSVYFSKWKRFKSSLHYHIPHGMLFVAEKIKMEY